MHIIIFIYKYIQNNKQLINYLNKFNLDEIISVDNLFVMLQSYFKGVHDINDNDILLF